MNEQTLPKCDQCEKPARTMARDRWVANIAELRAKTSTDVAFGIGAKRCGCEDHPAKGRLLEGANGAEVAGSTDDDFVFGDWLASRLEA